MASKENGKRWGATLEDWKLFSEVFGLRGDLLPVVSNPKAKISPSSSIKAIGKTPSIYNYKGEVVGLVDWTSKRATEQQIAEWSSNPDIGICVIAREGKPIDCDITEYALSEQVESFIESFLIDSVGKILPKRSRVGSPKFLLLFRCPEETTKRVIKTKAGIIEFLGNRQQFVAAGTHTDGARYEWYWRTSTPYIPELTLAQFDELWNALQDKFGVEPTIKERGAKQILVDLSEPIFQKLLEKNMILSEGRNGEYNILCPFDHEHTTESAESATVYYPAHTGGYEHASIKCLHAHCAHRNTEAFKEGLGLSPLDDFEDISDAEFVAPEPPQKKKLTGNPLHYKLEYAVPFIAARGNALWLAKDLIPMSSIGQIYGPPGGGKSFLVFDIAAAVSRGVAWRGHKTQKGVVVYVCAEGAYAFRNRIRAYMMKHELTELDMVILDGRPDLMKGQNVADLIASCEALGVPVKAIILDTYASCMSGDENSAQDTSKVLKGCSVLRDALGCVVILVHHSGKDVSRGARGNSSLRAGVDFEYLVTKNDGLHTFLNQKQKDGKEGFEYHFKLEEIVLELDEDLDPITSCVVQHTDEKPKGPDGKPVGVREIALFDGLSDYFNDFESWPTKEELVGYVNKASGHAKGDLNRTVSKLFDKHVFFTDGRVITFSTNTAELLAGDFDEFII